jgi:hypothetical protein
LHATLSVENLFKIIIIDYLYIFRASVVIIPKTPPLLSKQALEKKRRLKKEAEMQVGF